jgi:hypothetical protein
VNVFVSPPSSQQLADSMFPARAGVLEDVVVLIRDEDVTLSSLLPARSTALTAIVCELFETERELQL